MDHLFEKTIKTTPIYQGKVIDLQVDDVTLPNGQKSKREIVKHPGAVAILPITKEGKLVLVRQYRKALDKVIVEIPAGKLERGEEPDEAARRELEEETGYRPKALNYLISFYTSPGFADELIHLYECADLEKGEGALDADEFLDVLEVTLEEAERMISDQTIYDAKTAFAVQYMKLKEVGRT